LVLVARDEAKLKDIETEVHRINPKVETLFVALDITDEAAVKQLYTSIHERYGRHADILVANAAVSAATNGGGPVLHEAPVDKWWSNFVSNLPI
jgi:NAD(P)-dependent dehydrogenase (short-subunit alcohol dehydrogenase family)